MLAVLSLVWRYSWVTNKIRILLTSPFDFAAMRVVVGAIGMFLLMLIQGRSIRFQHGKFNMLIGLLQTSGFFLLTSWAMLHAGAGKTSVLVFIMPFWAAYANIAATIRCSVKNDLCEMRRMMAWKPVSMSIFRHRYP